MPDFGFDEWLDAQLRNVPVPRDWHARLSASRPPTDEELDAMVRDVPVPPHLERRLRRIAWLKRRPPTWGVLTMAASVLVVVATGAYFALLWEPTDRGKPLVGKRQEPQRLTQPRQIAQQAAPPRKRDPAPRRQTPITVSLDAPEQLAAEKREKVPSTLEDVAKVGTSIKQAIEAKLRTQAALGASGSIERLPDLDAFEAPQAHGVSPPRIRGYDMLFQLRHGEQPFVSPAAHRQLRVCRVPFTFGTSSYDSAAASLAQGQLPVRDEIRVEDFLAAQRYALPAAPSGGLALHAAASPAPLGAQGLHVLQLVVQGGRTSTHRRQPVRLIAVVDTSSAMQFDARFRILERALENLGHQLLAGDRLTVIGFAERPRVLVEDASRDQLQELLASGALKKTGGSADFAEAIQSACNAVQAVPSNAQRRVVFVTAARGEFDDAARTESRESLLQLAAANIPWRIVRLSPTDDDSLWDDLARRAHGRSFAITSADGLYAVLLEALSGRPPTVASGVSLRITFNPQVVTSYRMLGHASETLTGEAGDPLEIDLHAEQTAVSMFELWLNPAGKGELASAELLWRHPASGQPHRRVQPIRSSQVAASFAQAAPWLQQGILAARTAEYLGGSYFVPRSRRLSQLLDLAAEVDRRAAERPEFQALVRMIAQADRLD